MKSVLISVRPQWCAKIASGEKTLEVRKSRPKIDTPFKCYIYETQGKTDEPWADEDGHLDFHGCGQIIGAFVCGSTERMRYPDDGLVDVVDAQMSCLTAKEIITYSNGKPIYGWHISALQIYDKPRELSEFGLKRPPQSWCYVEEQEDSNGTN